ncbi:hypothetical protein LINPERPRIM_LOCUS35239, partial [Linum perenne]
ISLLKEDIITTLDKIADWGILPLDISCRLCEDKIDSRSHLFVDSVF